MIFSVAGNFDWEHIIDLIEQHCNNWRTGDASRHVEHYEPAQSINDIVVDKKLKQQIMILAMPAVDIKDPDYYAAVLGSSILGDGDGSRLYWNIYQKGSGGVRQCQHLGDGRDRYPDDAGQFYTGRGTTRPQNAACRTG